jgi:hypothetical protein
MQKMHQKVDNEYL